MAQGQRGGGGGGPPKKKDAGFNTPFSGLKRVVAKQKEQEARERAEREAAAKAAARPAPARGGPPPPGRPGKARDAQPPPDADEDALLFLSAMDGVREVRDERKKAPPPPLDPRLPQRLQDDNLEVLAQLSDMVSESGELAFSEQDASIEGALPGVDPKLLRSLREGKFGVQGQLDLHGLTQVEAERALDRFLSDARRTKKRCVLVVHGKGLNSPDQTGVLKRRVREWLTQKRLARGVLAFATARPQDGGAGALYVLLRRA